MAGIDRIMQKIDESGQGDGHLNLLANRRRAGVRLDAAYDLAVAGEGKRARELLSEARRLGGWSLKGVRIHLRSLVGGRGQ